MTARRSHPRKSEHASKRWRKKLFLRGFGWARYLTVVEVRERFGGA